MKQLFTLSFALLIALPGLAMEQKEAKFETKIGDKTKSLRYLIAVPEGYKADGDAVPLILFLHGAGERGSDLKKVKMHGPPKMVAKGHAFNAIVISPQCPAKTWWTAHTKTLIALLDQIEKDYNIDKDRIYVTGLSMGGYGTFALAGTQPDRFAAAVPICGGGTPKLAQKLTKLPMWVFHGDADKVIPVDESLRMVKAMNSKDGEHVKLTVYQGVGHNSWDRAYSDKKMWGWLFKQKRGK